LKEAMYDNKKLCQAYQKFFNEFKADTFTSPGMVPPGKASEIINSIFARWPGHGLPDGATLQQFVEDEYMKANEYDILLKDPSDFCLRYYLPRMLGALEPFTHFSPLPYILGMPNRFLDPAVRPGFRAALQAIIDYGQVIAEWQKPIMEFHQMALAAGYPSLMGVLSHAPFDILADTLRGTKGIVMDMYRQPDKLLETMEMLTSMNIDVGVDMANASGLPIVSFALHKGDDMFMSDQQFERFYWPTLKKVILGLIDEGCVPMLFAEGRYNNRLEIIKELPSGKVIWHFDKTDMFKAKEVLGDTACIAGNVPTSLLCTGTPEAVKEYCRQLIEVCGKGGGFLLTGGASIDKGNPDNLYAMIEAVEEYGVY
jgi:hypothetical protein